MWRSRHAISADGHPVATWDSRFWRTGGQFVLDGRRFQVDANMWGTRYTLTGADGTMVAAADRVGRKHWTVEAAGQTYRFQRRSLWSNDQELHTEQGPVGSVRRTSMWGGDVVADLPGLPLPVQIFVLGVVITMWDAQAAAG
ncbi:hypothetical protein EV385_4487 [Krasilnikovia cinnamomea]|uniref:Uncharacterized protein n=2 Tax=Krasilnikovia cinnamomea TaxID=349313 RepID=A0A4Q7ZPZ5_9ACTN|nr:hypothetical protein EV385_4487 [Krasilnikovia cinnamomea]